MAMKTTAIINQKGGVCKTTTALALSEGLTLKGYSVLLIDLDPQGNLSYSLADNGSDFTSYDLIQGKALETDTLKPISYKRYIIPSSPQLSTCTKISEYSLKRALEPLSNIYDYCIIDTPPSLGALTINALTASEGLVIPAQCDIYSLQGIKQLIDTISAVKALSNPGLEIRGILITRHNPRQIIKREVEAALREKTEELNIKIYDSHIRDSIAIPEAQMLKKGLLSYSKRSKAAQDYLSFTDEFIAQDNQRS